MEAKSYSEEQLEYALEKEKSKSCADCDLYYREGNTDACTHCFKESNWRPREKSSHYSFDDGIDMVNHPDHYKSETGLETIDVIEAFTFDLKGIEAVCTANVLKYICRWKKKNGLQDLEKAKWYLNKLIDRVTIINE